MAQNEQINTSEIKRVVEEKIENNEAIDPKEVVEAINARASGAHERNNKVIEKVQNYSGAEKSDIEDANEVSTEIAREIEKAKEEALQRILEVKNPDPKADPYQVYLNWKSGQQGEITHKGKEMAGQVESVAIGGYKKKFDTEGVLHSLNDYGELNFINYAANEGGREEVAAALDLVDKLYKDRTDLKANLLINNGNLDQAEELIVHNKDRELDMNMSRTLSNLDKKIPGSKERVLQKVKALDESYYKDLKEESERQN